MIFSGGHTVSARAAEPACSLECKQLTTKDYTDLLWTTVAEFPGEKTIFLIIQLANLIFEWQ